MRAGFGGTGSLTRLGRNCKRACRDLLDAYAGHRDVRIEDMTPTFNRRQALALGAGAAAVAMLGAAVRRWRRTTPTR